MRNTILILFTFLSVFLFGQTETMKVGKPCHDCTEIISKRTENTKFYQDNKSNKFYMEIAIDPYQCTSNHSTTHNQKAIPNPNGNDPDSMNITATVTTNNTLPQASITGTKRYNPCGFGDPTPCSYNLTVMTPANATITDIRWSFNYRALGACWLNDGAVDFTYNGCRSPGAPGFYWFCNSIGAGTCTGNNISIFGDFAACIPAPQCAPYAMNFTMNFYRSCWGAAGGCGNGCIQANSPWTMVVEGETVTNIALANGSPVTINGSCNVPFGLNANPSWGVPPYTYSWSAGPTPTNQTQTTSHNSNGTYTYNVTVTDACGETSMSSVNVVINDCPLPIELEDFDGYNKEDNKNYLYWVTSTETNNDYFILERSFGGEHWEDIATVPGAGTVSTPSFYDFYDLDYMDGINYYRLTQVDFDGAYETFKTVAINTTPKYVYQDYKIINLIGQEVPIDYNGIRIIVYEDGSRTMLLSWMRNPLRPR